LHDLRHGAASLLLEGDINPVVVAEVLGHSSPNTTLGVYGHARPNTQVRAVAFMDKLFRGVGGDSGDGDLAHKVSDGGGG
jgi:integrase